MIQIDMLDKFVEAFYKPVNEKYIHKNKALTEAKNQYYELKKKSLTKVEPSTKPKEHDELESKFNEISILGGYRNHKLYLSKEFKATLAYLYKNNRLDDYISYLVKNGLKPSVQNAIEFKYITNYLDH